MVQYAHSVITDSTAIAALFSSGVDLKRLQIGAVLWLIVIWLCFAAVKILVEKTTWGRARLQHCNNEQKEVFVMWVVELLITTFSLAVLWRYLGFTIMTGSFNRAFYTDTPDTDWKKEIGYLSEVRDAMIGWAYAGQPMLFLYLYEIVTASAAREKQSTHHLLTMHHFLVIILITFGMKAVTETMNPLWGMQMSWLFNLMVTEQFIWIALIVHRLRLPYRQYALIFATITEIISRLVIWGFILHSYSWLCFLQCTRTMWEIVWRAAFPILAFLMIIAQSLVIRIHIQLCKKVWILTRKQTSEALATSHSEAKTNDSSSSNEPIAANKVDDWEDEIEACNDTSIDSDTSESVPSTACSTSSSTAFPGYFMAAFIVLVIALINGVELISPDAGIVEVRCKNIAVVGGGAAGIAASWALSVDQNTDYSITMFEKDAVLGGNVLTSYSESGKPVELGVQFLGTHEYSNLHSFFRHINMSTVVDYRGLSASAEDKNGNRATMFNYFSDFPIENTEGRQVMDGITSEIRRFQELLFYNLSETFTEEQLMTITLDQILQEHNFSTHFKDYYIMGCVQLATTSRRNAYEFALGPLIALEIQFPICTAFGKIPQRVIFEGIGKYIEKSAQLLRDSGKVDIHTNSDVAAVKHSSRPGAPVKLLVNGTWRQFDQVVFAVQKKDALKIVTNTESSKLPAPSVYRTSLGDYNTEGRITYDDASVMSHMDEEFVSRHISDLFTRGCRNVDGLALSTHSANATLDKLMAKGASNEVMYVGHIPSTAATAHCSLNYSMPFGYFFNASDPYATSNMPHPDKVIDTITWTQPAHDISYFKSQRAAYAIQGQRQMWFAGSETGFNYHETAWMSGFVAAHALGADYPFDSRSMAKNSFLLHRSWMLYGLNPFISQSSRRSEDCPRCP